MKSKLKSRNVVDTITHYLPTVILGIAAVFGLDQSQSNALVQSVGSIFGGILTIAPIVVHVFRNFQANKYELKLSELEPKDVVNGASDVFSRFNELTKGYQDNVRQLKALKQEIDSLQFQIDSVKGVK